VHLIDTVELALGSAVERSMATHHRGTTSRAWCREAPEPREDRSIDVPIDGVEVFRAIAERSTAPPLGVHAPRSASLTTAG
jgi:hypothetical protein